MTVANWFRELMPALIAAKRGRQNTAAISKTMKLDKLQNPVTA
jgi:hypothetical protein